MVSPFAAQVYAGFGKRFPKRRLPCPEWCASLAIHGAAVLALAAFSSPAGRHLRFSEGLLTTTEPGPWSAIRVLEPAPEPARELPEPLEFEIPETALDPEIHEHENAAAPEPPEDETSLPGWPLRGPARWEGGELAPVLAETYSSFAAPARNWRLPSMVAPDGDRPSPGPGAGTGQGPFSSTGEAGRAGLGGPIGPEVGAGSGAGAGSGSEGTGAAGSASASSGKGGGFVPPRVRKKPAVTYPAEAKRKGLEGTTVLSIEVLEDGGVGKVSVIQGSGHEALDQAARESAAKWRFDPAREEGRAVRGSVRMVFVHKFVDDP